MKLLKKLLFLIPALVALLIHIILSQNPQLAETVFSRGISRFFANTVGSVVAVLPFSLTEVFVYLAVLAFIVSVVLMIMRRLKVGKFFKVVLWTVSIAFLVYTVSHGANFYRLTLSEITNTEEKTVSTEELYNLCTYAGEKAAEERKQCKEDENGTFTLSRSLKETVSDISGYDKISVENAVFKGSINSAKSVFSSKLWSYTGITGMYFPLWSECNINSDVPEWTVPHAAMHELAHARQFAREDECNFIGFYACINADSADLRYSGRYFCFILLSDELYSRDPELYKELLSETDSGIIRDMKAEIEYWERFSGGIEDVSGKINDLFISSQGVDEGAESYSEASKLLIPYMISEQSSS